MATSYPASLDTFHDPLSTDTMANSTTPHLDQHGNINDAVAAIETAVGITGAFNFVSAGVLTSRTFAIAGAIAVPSGSTNYIPPFFEPVSANTTKKLVEVHYIIETGTSVTFSVNQNGTGITGLTALSATTTAAGTAPTTPPSVANGDLFAIVVSAISGSPANLTVSLVFETL